MSHGHSDDHYGEPGAVHEAVPVDPENDIDAKSATRWVVGGAIVFFIGMWFLILIFVRVLEVEQREKINQAPTTELDETREAEQQFLRGANPTRKSIDKVVEGLRPKADGPK
jgi:hypothetical protein